MNKFDLQGSRLFRKFSFQRFRAVVAWVLLVFIVYATLGPLRQRPHVFDSASIERLMAFAFLGAAFLIAYPRRLAFVCSIVLGSAGLLEFLQTLTLDRHGRLIDAFEKIAGGSLGILAASVLLYFLSKNQRLTGSTD